MLRWLSASLYAINETARVVSGERNTPERGTPADQKADEGTPQPRQRKVEHFGKMGRLQKFAFRSSRICS